MHTRKDNQKMIKYQNPVIKGYNPDPSICRVGDDYYLVTSSFEFFPGVPIYHSKNLVNWTLINYCLTRDSQLKLDDCRCSGGIFAPTIRYHDGIFYMITTNVTDKGNFIVHTKDIYGEWSQPQWVDQGGIDSSLLFADDKAYFCSTTHIDGRQGIALCEVNPLTGERLTPSRIICGGAGGKFPEAPHLYKIRGKYYLMIAEGGTEYGHMETMFCSEDIYGEYESCPFNPILSHKDFMGSPIQATGHADIVEDTNGNWWMVCLGIRPISSGLLHNLGRETFLSPLTWDENNWPIVGDRGRISLEMEAPLPAELKASSIDFEDNFDGEKLKLDWNFVRNPIPCHYDLKQRKGFLKLSAGEEYLNSAIPTFVGIRQKEFEICAQTKLEVKDLREHAKAGITAFYNQNYYYALYLTMEDGKCFVALSTRIHDSEYLSQKVEINFVDSIELKIDANQIDYRFSYRLQDEWIELGTAKTAGLCTETTMTMTFTGTYLGLFASNADTYFDYFKAYKSTGK